MNAAKFTDPTRPGKLRPSLLRDLTANPSLPEYIRRLPARVLNKLIVEVGLEDSQEILALMSAEQVKAVLSISLWKSSRPGQEETLDLDQFIRWIDLWMQHGEPALARRVLELGEDFMVACLAQLLVTVDRTVVGLAERGVELGQYVIFPKQEQRWPSVVAALRALWQHEPDFLLRVLRRCCFERSILSEDVSEHLSAESLYQDIAAARDAERTVAGYVDPRRAALFLSTAKTTDLEELCELRAYDLNTASDLQKLKLPRISERISAPLADVDAVKFIEHVAAQSQNRRRDEVDSLDSLLREAGILHAPNATPLLSDHSRAVPRSQLLETALASLAHREPEVASRRMGELAYLSNALMSGAEMQGSVFTERNAALVALATANLGMTHLLQASERTAVDMERACELLEKDPGVVRLFQIGYHLLCKIPGRCCEAVYRAKAVQARRPGHVVIMEMDEILGSTTLTDRVREGLYGEAKSLIDGLAAAMDSAACVALRILMDPTPCFPRVLESGPGSASIHVDQGYRPIAAMEDIERIDDFLADLPKYCGN